MDRWVFGDDRPQAAELTLSQAAELRAVSESFVFGLLDAGRIEGHGVGADVRIDAASLLDYRRRDDRERRDAADELTALAQDMGLI